MGQPVATILLTKGPEIGIIAKIENPKGMDNLALHEAVPVVDGLLCRHDDANHSLQRFRQIFALCLSDEIQSCAGGSCVTVRA